MFKLKLFKFGKYSKIKKLKLKLFKIGICSNMKMFKFEKCSDVKKGHVFLKF
jgi:hypothetical protein